MTRWPDKEDRQSRACDAYAEAPDTPPLAIEHTLVQTFNDQKKDSARFMKICGELEDELKTTFSFRVSLTISTFSITTGGNWNKIKDTLHDWLVANVDKLPWGRSDHQVTDVPFPFTIKKRQDSNKQFGVARWAPSPVEGELVGIIARALSDKNDQLSKYRSLGATTILLLESDDIALVNWPTLYSAFLAAQQCVSTPNIDQVWLARTYESQYESGCEICCFLGPEPIMDVANPPNFMFGPHYSKYWAAEIVKDVLLQKSIKRLQNR